MGKDTELLEASRNGNLSIVEKILNQKSKRSGPLASLRRGPGANVQDSSGYSALHHAALNGHNDIIRLLLVHDASPNLPDARGSSPLHLAAWAGHQDIVKLFLTLPNRPANPNLQTIENETPLHCAARHGHTGALTTLLAHGADPNVKNNHHETPLDLAAQYGRLQAVQMLIRAHPELLLPFKIITKKNVQINDINSCSSSNNIINNHNHCNLKLLNNSTGNNSSSSNNIGLNCGRSAIIQQQQSIENESQIFNHSPLHLASRNGHKNVVEVLLAAGVNVNLLTPSGTALHEAALCGKDIVVRTLLDYGANLDATDCEGRTALDILEEFPPHVTKGIVAVINNHRNSILYDSESDDMHRDNSHNKNYNITSATTPMCLGSSYENNRRCSPVRNYSHHDITTSPSSSMGSLGPPSPRQRTSICDLSDFYITMTPSIKNNQIAPKKPPRRNLYISPTHLSLSSSICNNEINNCDDIIGIATSSSSNNSNSGNNNGYGRINQHHLSSLSLSTNKQKYYQQNHHDYYDQQQQQQHENNSISFDTSNNFNNTKITSQKPNCYEYVYMAHTGPKLDEKFNNRSKSVDQYVEMNINSNNIQQQNERKPKPAPRNLLANVNYENTTLKSYNPNRKLKRNRESYESFNIDFNKEKINYNMKNYPQSPTNYQQPPTPEHPPPPPSQAEKIIHDRIRPLSQEYKRISGLLLTMESGTSPQDNLCHNITLRASSGSISSSISISDRSVSTDCVEEFIGDVPFAGLFKGSTMNLNNCSNSSSNNYQIGYQQQQKHYISKNLPQKQFLYQSEEQLLTSSMVNNCYLLSSSIDNQSKILNEHNDQSISLNLNINNYQSVKRNQRSLSFGDILDNCDNNDNDDNDIDKNSHYYNNTNNLNYDNNIHYNNNKYNIHNNDDDHDDDDDNNSAELLLLLKNDEIYCHQNNDDIKKLSLKQQHINNDEILSPFNEKEAWAKISEIMESFGSGILSGTSINKTNKNIISNGDNINDDDDSVDKNYKIIIDKNNFQQKKKYKNELNKILIEWNLIHIEKNLIDNGFDNIEFMNGIIDENDIMAINISETDSTKLIKFIQKLPIAKSLPNLYNNIDSNNSTSSNNNIILNVDQWLYSIDLEEYINVFRKHLYTHMESVCRIWEVELQTVLQINKLGHRKRILYSVSANRKHNPPIKSDKTTIDVLNADLNILKANIMELQDDIIDKLPSPSIADVHDINSDKKQQQQSSLKSNLNRTNGPPIRHSNKKNRPAPKPPIKLPPTIPLSSTQSLEIRAPSELLLGLPSNLRTQWRHTATSLVSGTVKYDVYYLGSTVVKELRGTESTRKSIQKLKRDNHIKLLTSVTNQQTSSALSGQIDKKRPIRLAISQRGVEFIDYETQEKICEHEIRNINCACQDADDLSHFAYITKDSDMNIHYCHVFNVDSMDLATEIILTLGQAFEVAYQLVLLDTSTSTSNKTSTLAQIKLKNINDEIITCKQINNTNTSDTTSNIDCKNAFCTNNEKYNSNFEPTTDSSTTNIKTENH